MRIPPNSLVMGIPARVVRETTPDERARLARTIQSYLELQDAHRRGDYPAAG
jgi:carbonic anhydrase/acetyltransferase-like protein (isoleucine patch superfamily)